MLSARWVFNWSLEAVVADALDLCLLSLLLCLCVCLFVCLSAHYNCSTSQLLSRVCMIILRSTIDRWKMHGNSYGFDYLYSSVTRLNSSKKLRVTSSLVIKSDSDMLNRRLSVTILLSLKFILLTLLQCRTVRELIVSNDNILLAFNRDVLIWWFDIFSNHFSGPGRAISPVCVSSN